MSNLVLVVGDLHVPYRSSEIQKDIKKLLAPGQISHVLCTGNLCTKEMYTFLQSISPKLTCVKGDFDDKMKGVELKETEVLQFGQLKIGLIHGHQVVPWGDKEALAIVQRKLNVDILISGHTHQFEHYQYQNHLFLNPGSLTGAYNGLNKDPIPSLLLLDIQSTTVTTYHYYKSPEKKKVLVDKYNFEKE